jgi:hypothetical protein
VAEVEARTTGEEEVNINPDMVPSTIREAVDMIVAGLDEKERLFVKQQPNSSTVHFGAGMSIRNGWSLWAPDSPLKRDAVNTYKIAHADDISGLIFEWVWASVRGDAFDPVSYCQRFEQHWQRICGQTALQAGGWPPDRGFMGLEQP